MCAICGGDMDRQAYHAQACRRGSATRTPRHHRVQHAVQAALRWAGCAVTRGQAVPGLPGHIPDLTVDTALAPTTHVEVYVPHPRASNQGARRLAEGAGLTEAWTVVTDSTERAGVAALEEAAMRTLRR